MRKTQLAISVLLSVVFLLALHPFLTGAAPHAQTDTPTPTATEGPEWETPVPGSTPIPTPSTRFTQTFDPANLLNPDANTGLPVGSGQVTLEGAGGSGAGASFSYPAIELPEAPSLDLPDSLNLPAWPNFTQPSFPASLEVDVLLPSPPDMSLVSFPESVLMPEVPEFAVPSVVSSLNLPAPVEIHEPPNLITYERDYTAITLPSLDLPTDTADFPTVPVVTDTQEMSDDVGGLLAKYQPIISLTKQVRNDIEAWGDYETMEIGGQTAQEMATTLAEDMTDAMSYVRAGLNIPVIGPSVTVTLAGFAWVILVTFVKLVAKVNFTVFDQVKDLVKLIADAIG